MPLPMYHEENKQKQIIAIASGKGGVGKSTVTVNLGLALKELGYSVGIMDVDIYGPSLRKMLPEEKAPTQKGQLIIPAESHGIKTISMAYFRKGGEAAAVRAPIANGIITQFIENVDWGELDFLLIDFPPGTGDVQLTMSQRISLSGALVVTTPQELALIDVRRAIDLFKQVHVPILGIVENMCYYVHPTSEEKVYLFGKGGGKRLAGEMGVPLMGQIPLDPAICLCSDTGKSLFEQPSPLTQTYIELAKGLIGAKKEQSQLEIWQKDSHSFSVKWENGVVKDYCLSEMQKQCPCAQCKGAGTSQRDVGASKIETVGRYAIRIAFTSGCSAGIYDLESMK